jgi:ATP-dependent protease ClpP protease subunit
MAELYIEGYIGGDATAKQVRDFLNSTDGDVTVRINSGGGSVSEGFAIHDLLKSSGRKIKTVVEGMCGSIATVIAQAGKDSGGRYMHANSDFFVHNPFWEPYAPIPMEADQLASLAEDLQKVQDKILNFYSSVTGRPVEELAPIVARQTTLTAQEAIDLGFIDGIEAGEITMGKRFEIKAYIDTAKQKQNSMNDKITGMLNALVKRVFKDATVKTTEGVDIYFDGEIAVGTKIFTNPEMTEPAPDGVHTVGDKLYTVKDGVVTQEAEIESKQLEKEKEKVAALTAELEAAKAELESIKAETSALVAEIKNFKANYKAPETPKAEAVDTKAVEAPVSLGEQILNIRKQKQTNK